MQRTSVTLHVEFYTIEDDKRLRIGIDRIDTTDKHCCTLIKVAGMHIHTDVATQFLSHLLIDGDSLTI